MRGKSGLREAIYIAFPRLAGTYLLSGGWATAERCTILETDGATDLWTYGNTESRKKEEAIKTDSLMDVRDYQELQRKGRVLPESSNFQ